MPKLLVKNPQGLQELIEIKESGSYYDLSRVLWDERKDGSFPVEHLQSIGGLVRVANHLEVDPAALAAQQTALEARATQLTQKRTRLRQAEQFLRNLDLSQALTAQQIQQALGALIRLARND